jgi:hypothetical protein
MRTDREDHIVPVPSIEVDPVVRVNPSTKNTNVLNPDEFKTKRRVPQVLADKLECADELTL